MRSGLEGARCVIARHGALLDTVGPDPQPHCAPGRCYAGSLADASYAVPGSDRSAERPQPRQHDTPCIASPGRWPHLRGDLLAATPRHSRRAPSRCTAAGATVRSRAGPERLHGCTPQLRPVVGTASSTRSSTSAHPDLCMDTSGSEPARRRPSARAAATQSRRLSSSTEAVLLTPPLRTQAASCRALPSSACTTSSAGGAGRALGSVLNTEGSQSEATFGCMHARSRRTADAVDADGYRQALRACLVSRWNESVSN